MGMLSNCPPFSFFFVISFLVRCICFSLLPLTVSLSFSGLVTCGRRCGKPLRCGDHFCTRTCHEGPCQPEDPRRLPSAITSSRPVTGGGAAAEGSWQREREKERERARAKAEAMLKLATPVSQQLPMFGGPESGGGCGQRCPHIRVSAASAREKNKETPFFCSSCCYESKENFRVLSFCFLVFFNFFLVVCFVSLRILYICYFVLFFCLVFASSRY